MRDTIRPMATEEDVRIRVLTADDHPVVRAGIVAMLAHEPDIDVVAQASNGAEAIALFEAERPDVVLMDLQMPKVDGVSAIRAIRAIDPSARVIALTTYDGDADIHRALSAGACAYLIKDAMMDQLTAAIRSAAAGKRLIPPSVAGKLAEFTPRADLTAREEEVLQHVARGLGNKEIAEAIGRSPETVKAHLESIFRKLDAKDRAHAVTIALQRGFIHLDR
jgi:two-component system NarL family response regulator